MATKDHYVALGLCSVCAAQAAYGHQIGFIRTNAPCSSCLPLILALPVNEPGEWRSSSPRRSDASTLRRLRVRALESIR